MIGDLFDSPWKIAIIAILIIVLFGSRKLPEAARSLGKSMRILKTEVSSLHHDDDDQPAPAAVTPVPVPAPIQVAVPVTDHQAQIDALSKQLADLQQTVSVNGSSDSAQAK